MGVSTFGYQPAALAGTYWRRRCTVLVLGMAGLGLAAWGLSTALAVVRQDARPVPARQHARTAKSPAPSKAGQSGTREPGARPGSDPSAGGQAAPAPAETQPASGSAGQANGGGTILPAFCARHAIVLSIFTGQTRFGRRQWPAFNINVVSTQQPECSFNIGSRHIALVIKEGPARVWSSADCAAGSGGLIAALERGVPTVLAISWDRRTSAPGCGGRSIGVPPGSYTAYAVDGNLTSTPVNFRLN